MKILMVLTSHDVLGNTGRKTGCWLEEFAAPYFVSRDAGVQLTLASPKGGQPPLDPKSDLPESQTPAMSRFKQDLTAQKALSQTVKLADVKSEDHDTVFYVGGHGPVWDLAESPASIALLESFCNSGKPIALVCHSPGVLRHVTYQGAPLVRGKHVTGFTHSEEEEMSRASAARQKERSIMEHAESTRISRRRLLAIAGVSAGAAMFAQRPVFADRGGVAPVAANATANPKNTSFASLKQIDAGLLNVGYAYVRLFSFGGLPLLAVLASQSPAIGRLLFARVQPAIETLH